MLTQLNSLSIFLIVSLDHRSRWLVGSSIMMICGLDKSIFVSATFAFSHHDNVAIFWSIFSLSISRLPNKFLVSLMEIHGQTISFNIVFS